MTDPKKTPETIEDEALDDVNGGTVLTTNENITGLRRDSGDSIRKDSGDNVRKDSGEAHFGSWGTTSTTG